MTNISDVAKAKRSVGKSESEGSKLTENGILTPKDRDDENYFLRVNIYDYDETIVAHPLMDQIKSAICERIVVSNSADSRPLRVLDLGCGSGQLARAMAGLSNVQVELCDPDPTSEKFCKEHPELEKMKFHSLDILSEPDVELLEEGKFDIVASLGVLHHIPPGLRDKFIKNCKRLAPIVIIADEGLAEYSNEEQRISFVTSWYDFVIDEAVRRGISKLANFERRFKKSDLSATRLPTDDFKVSVSSAIKSSEAAGLSVRIVRTFGDWETNKGGMFLLEVA
jgi:SAM-dependent methyltransferase